MIKEFENLREDEVKVLLDAPLYVAILIAGADGDIDKSERKEAIDVARSKQSRAREQLVEYYKIVGENYEQKFNDLIDKLPSGTEEREKEITSDIDSILQYLFSSSVAIYLSLFFCTLNYMYKTRSGV